MTTARIIVEIPDEMKGKTFSFKDGYSFKYSTPNTTIPMDCKYVSVYTHGDGYVEGGVGDELTKNYQTFEDIMENVICCGDGSYIGSPYHGWRGEDFDKVCPKFTNSLDEIQRENYNYLFKLDDKWYVQCNYDDAYQDFTLISAESNAVCDELNKLKKVVKALQSEVNERMEELTNEIDTIIKKTK